LHFSAQWKITLAFTLGALITLAVMVRTENSAWDGEVYWQAAQSLAHGSDPYTDGIVRQRTFHDAAHHAASEHPPMTYVYSPITLPLLKLIGTLPAWLVGCGYYLLLAIGILLQFWAAWHLCSPTEGRWLILFMPASIYFPGLLNDDVILSGNVVYLLYGLVLAAAVSGWQRNRWAFYYAAVFLASLCKAPLLTLLALPLLVGKRQWIATTATAAAGLAAFAVQGILWPQLFAEYLTAVQLQFDWNDDFGFGPAGLLGHILRSSSMPFDLPVKLLYLAFAAVLFTILLWLSRNHFTGSDRLQWIAVALVATILLNPRVKEYDVAAITLPMLLILKRFAARIFAASGALHPAHEFTLPAAKSVFILSCAGWFLAANFLASGDLWKPTELALLLLTVTAGSWSLVGQRQRSAMPLAAEAKLTIISTRKVAILQ